MPEVSQTVLDWTKAELDGKDREIERLRAVLQRCHSVLWFDLRNSLSFGPDYNQAVRDVALAVAEALEVK